MERLGLIYFGSPKSLKKYSGLYVHNYVQSVILIIIIFHNVCTLFQWQQKGIYN